MYMGGQVNTDKNESTVMQDFFWQDKMFIFIILLLCGIHANPVSIPKVDLVKSLFPGEEAIH